MKIKVSDYIAEFLADNGLTQIFTVVGGGAMHLNDSFGHHPKLHCLYNHHEQASAIAAEAYSRISGTPGVVCVTSGPGAVNALNGVAGAYQDSIPLIVFSGQVKSTLTVRHSGLALRTLGGQEFDIVSAIGNMTKYAEMVTDPLKIRYCMEKALYMAINGRPGPCWLDMPLDIQGMMVESKELMGFEPLLDKNTSEICWDKIKEKLRNARRPVIYAGNSIRTSGGYEVFRKLIEMLQIPVVMGWNSIDLLPTDHPLYAGRGGTMGDRAGNFAVQNSDLVLSLGSRLSIYQVGYDVHAWAKNAYVIAVDIDSEELKKPTVRIDMPVCSDVKLFMEEMLALGEEVRADCRDWISRCMKWRETYPVVLPKHYEQKELCNVYAFINELSASIPEGMDTVVANGSASVVGSQTYIIKEHQHFIMNCAFSSMGYDLPAAVGVCMANDKKPLVCIAGDGSIQMNLQELQTIITNKLPVKIFVINNQGYHQIRLTQRNIFTEHSLVGVGTESGDLSFPSMEKIACAYGYPYFSCSKNSDLGEFIKKTLCCQEPLIAEVFVDTKQIYEPKSATKKLPDGTLASPPLEDMAPFLPREELEKNMSISWL